MKKTVCLLFLSCSLFAQDPDFAPLDFKVNGGQTSMYVDAIQHYIDSIYYNDTLIFDTLFILKNQELSANFFPNRIRKVNISFQDTATVFDRLKNNNQASVINVFADQNSGKEKINVLIVALIFNSDRTCMPTKSCRVKYIYNRRYKNYDFNKIVCDY